MPIPSIAHTLTHPLAYTMGGKLSRAPGGASYVGTRKRVAWPCVTTMMENCGRAYYDYCTMDDLSHRDGARATTVASSSRLHTHVKQSVATVSVSYVRVYVSRTGCEENNGSEHNLRELSIPTRKP